MFANICTSKFNRDQIIRKRFNTTYKSTSAVGTWSFSGLASSTPPPHPPFLDLEMEGRMEARARQHLRVWQAGQDTQPFRLMLLAGSFGWGYNSNAVTCVYQHLYFQGLNSKSPHIMSHIRYSISYSQEICTQGALKTLGRLMPSIKTY